MKVIMTQLGIELVPETEFEKTCLEHVAKQSMVTLKFRDEWNSKGNLIIEGKPDEWGVR